MINLLQLFYHEYYIYDWEIFMPSVIKFKPAISIAIMGLYFSSQSGLELKFSLTWALLIVCFPATWPNSVTEVPKVT